MGAGRRCAALTGEERAAVRASLLDVDVRVRRRVGIDLDPIDVTTDDGARLLRVLRVGRAGRAVRPAHASDRGRPGQSAGARARRLRARAAGRAARRPTLVFQTAAFPYVSTRRAPRCGRRLRGRGYRSSSSRREGRATGGLGNAHRDAIPAESASSPGTPTSTARGSSTRCDHVARTTRSSSSSGELLESRRAAREGGAVRDRGRGSRRRGLAAGIEPVELLVAGEDVEPALIAEAVDARPPASRASRSTGGTRCRVELRR